MLKSRHNHNKSVVAVAMAVVIDNDTISRGLFSMTTFMSLPGKFEQSILAIMSILSKHSATELLVMDYWLIVNEVDPNGADWEPAFRKTLSDRAVPTTVLSRLHFIQKKAECEKGQGFSLNMILDRIRSEPEITAWMHWEESWTNNQEGFLPKVVAVLKADDQISQLQLTNDWHDTPAPRKENRKHKGLEYVVIRAAETQEWYDKTPCTSWGTYIRSWPLFSLRPFVADAQLMASCGNFSTEKRLWPIAFEWEFGVNWLRACFNQKKKGSPKAVLLHTVAHRQQGHRSTYTQGQAQHVPPPAVVPTPSVKQPLVAVPKPSEHQPAVVVQRPSLPHHPSGGARDRHCFIFRTHVADEDHLSHAAHYVAQLKDFDCQVYILLNVPDEKTDASSPVIIKWQNFIKTTIPDAQLTTFGEADIRREYPQYRGAWLEPQHGWSVFYKRHPKFEHYWFWEYDARFSGHVVELISTHLHRREDVLGTWVAPYPGDGPEWVWWHENGTRWLTPNAQKWKYFACVTRASNRFLASLAESMRHEWSMIETYIATMAVKNFGENALGNLDKQYWTEKTVVFRPIHANPDDYLKTILPNRPRLIFHPVK